MRLRFLWIGKTKHLGFRRLEEEYLQRLRRFFPVECDCVEDRKKAKGEHTAAQLEREAQEIERRINAPGRFVLLDERGVQMSSMEVADLVEQWLNRSVPDVTFLVGGFRGIPDRVKDLADLRWSLSKLTLQHELARVVLLEQIYRAVSIVKGLPYHR